jgi:hypothetical protein
MLYLNILKISFVQIERSSVCYPIWTLRKLDTHRFLGNKEDELI